MVDLLYIHLILIHTLWILSMSYNAYVYHYATMFFIRHLCVKVSAYSPNIMFMYFDIVHLFLIIHTHERSGSYNRDTNISTTYDIPIHDIDIHLCTTKYIDYSFFNFLITNFREEIKIFNLLVSISMQFENYNCNIINLSHLFGQFIHDLNAWEKYMWGEKGQDNVAHWMVRFKYAKNYIYIFINLNKFIYNTMV